MLTSESVAEGLAILASAYRRKISAEMTLVYHRVLHRHLVEHQFEDAVNSVLEHEKTFPTPSVLLTYGRSFSRNKHERGEPYVDDTPLRSLLEAVHDRGLPLPPTEVQFSSTIERLEYEDAVVTQGIPKTNGVNDEGILDGVRRIATKAEENMAKIAAMEAARRGT
jgi:hypothetical protein